eukprot:6664585-Lingulodinium_polyedra.AAC.1
MGQPVALTQVCPQEIKGRLRQAARKWQWAAVAQHLGATGPVENFWLKPVRELVLGKKGLGAALPIGAYMKVASGATWPRSWLADHGK